MDSLAQSSSPLPQVQVHELVYGQSWKPVPEPGFNPATVRLAKKGDLLEIEARLHGLPIVDPEARFNDAVYKRGDVFELFLRAKEDEVYHEIHITPSNVLLQLRFAVGASRPFSIEQAKVWEPLLQSSSTERFDGGWIARMCLPLTNLTGQRPIPVFWQIGCGRYDYPQIGARPVISNTAPLSIPDFHRIEEWPVLDLG